MEAGHQVKVEGKPNDLIERILADESFNIDKKRLQEILEPKNFIGMAEVQTERFIQMCINPIIEKHKECKVVASELTI